MIDAKFLADFIQSALTQAPVFIVALIGIVVTLNRWKDAPGAGLWSLLGFGIAALLCILVPAGQMGVRYWISNNSGHASEFQAAFMVLAIVWSVLRAAGYVLLLVAIFAGRPQSA